MGTTQTRDLGYWELGFAVDAAPFCFVESRHAAGERIGLHRHDTPHLSIVIKGGFQEASGPHDRECPAGAVVVHPGDDAHSDRIGPDGAVCLNILVQDASLDQAFLETFASERVVLENKICRRAGHLYRMLGRKNRQRALADEALEFFGLLSREPRPGRTPPKWLREIADRLNEEPVCALNLAELAAAANVHPVHLSRSFFAFYRMTLGDHRRKRRIEWARDQLSDGNLSLAHIASDAGFCDQAHFTRAFRTRFGMTPAAFRRAAEI